MRRLAAADAESSRRLGWEAFGVPATRPATPATLELPGTTWFGAYEDGRLVARMVDRDYESWFGGVRVPTSGIAGVTVAAEARGRGLLRPLFAETLAYAKSRGALVSTLFPTAPRIYRRFGYEVIADYVTVRLPTAVLAEVPRPAQVTTRRATLGDVEAAWSLYDAWACAQNGPLTRRGVSFPTTPAEFLEAYTGVSVAVDETGQVCGFVTWDRGQGYDEDARMQLDNLFAATADAHRALLNLVGSFSTVAPTTLLDTSGDDLARLLLPSLPWQVVHASPYMLKILDVPGALSAPRYAAGLTAALPFALDGDVLAENNGAYVLRVRDGVGRCEVADGAERVFTPQGLALLFAGSLSCANLRAVNHLRGGAEAEDLTWDALFGGRQPHIRDYF